MTGAIIRLLVTFKMMCSSTTTNCVGLQPQNYKYKKALKIKKKKNEKKNLTIFWENCIQFFFEI